MHLDILYDQLGVAISGYGRAISRHGMQVVEGAASCRMGPERMYGELGHIINDTKCFLEEVQLKIEVIRKCYRVWVMILEIERGLN